MANLWFSIFKIFLFQQNIFFRARKKYFVGTEKNIFYSIDVEFSYLSNGANENLHNCHLRLSSRFLSQNVE